MWFRIVGEIVDVRIIAVGRSIREIERLKKAHGRGRWRKLKGSAVIELPDGVVRHAELHWYEAHGVGRREIKVKRVMKDE
jgi:hypothetical protein